MWSLSASFLLPNFGHLAEASTDKSRLVTDQIWLKEIGRDFDGMNEVWNA